MGTLVALNLTLPTPANMTSTANIQSNSSPFNILIIAGLPIIVIGFFVCAIFHIKSRLNRLSKRAQAKHEAKEVKKYSQPAFSADSSTYITVGDYLNSAMLPTVVVNYDNSEQVSYLSQQPCYENADILSSLYTEVIDTYDDVILTRSSSSNCDVSDDV